jgi:hypothetical protein
MDEPVPQTNLMKITDHASVTRGLDKLLFATVSKPTLQLTLQPIHFRIQWAQGINFKKVNGPMLEAEINKECWGAIFLNSHPPCSWSVAYGNVFTL